jgi:hypothetical protein
MSLIKKISKLGFIAPLLAGFDNSVRLGFSPPAKESERESTLRLKASREKIAKSNGLKLFTINGKSVWALNEANAIRKLKKAV